MKITPRLLKGFRDFLPREAYKRQYVIDKLQTVFKLSGFEPLETPVLEYADILTGKYGEEGDKLMYTFEDKGKRQVAMRYDQTVPLARAVAQYVPAGDITLPFKRYQLQNVWRGENTQKGRFREFLQCDIDIIGSDSILSDAEIVATAARAMQTLGFKKYKILINDREILKMRNAHLGGQNDGTDPQQANEEDLIVIRALDKLKKIGEEKVIEEIEQNTHYTKDQAKAWIKMLLEEIETTDYLKKIIHHLDALGVGPEEYEFSPTLARGLDYYTGLIFEIEVPEYTAGSVCGGGRYDNLIGMFAGQSIPAVGCAFGFDRIIEAMDVLDMFPAELAYSATKALITIFSEELKETSIDVCSLLRSNNISAEVYLGEVKNKNPLEKQLKYANQKGIRYVIIIGPEEKEKQVVMVKDMKTREQKEIKVENLVAEFS